MLPNYFHLRILQDTVPWVKIILKSSDEDMS